MAPDSIAQFAGLPLGAAALWVFWKLALRWFRLAEARLAQDAAREIAERAARREEAREQREERIAEREHHRQEEKERREERREERIERHVQTEAITRLMGTMEDIGLDLHEVLRRTRGGLLEQTDDIETTGPQSPAKKGQ